MQDPFRAEWNRWWRILGLILNVLSEKITIIFYRVATKKLGWWKVAFQHVSLCWCGRRWGSINTMLLFLPRTAPHRLWWHPDIILDNECALEPRGPLEATCFIKLSISISVQEACGVEEPYKELCFSLSLSLSPFTSNTISSWYLRVHEDSKYKQVYIYYICI